MRLLPEFRETNRDYAIFKERISAEEVMQGLDNQPDVNEDEAYSIARQTWLEICKSNSSQSEMLFSFKQYLKLIQSRAKGFSYKIYGDDTQQLSGNLVKKLMGVLWMTATMRRNLELFGVYLCFDMMMRGINTLLWPYVAVTMIDKLGQICLGCKGFACGKRIDMYRFVVDFIRESCPGLDLSKVKIVAADQFMTQENVRAFGFSNANFVMDRWHLLLSGLEKSSTKQDWNIFGII